MPTRGRPPALTTTGLTKSYGDLVALEPLDLVVPQGQRLALIGHNGSGKTTLLRMAAGLLEPSGGTISVAGEPAGSLGARASLSYLSDNPVLIRRPLGSRAHRIYLPASRRRGMGAAGCVPALRSRVAVTGRGSPVALLPGAATEDRDRAGLDPPVLAAARGRAIHRARPRRSRRPRFPYRGHCHPGGDGRDRHPSTRLRRHRRPLS